MLVSLRGATLWLRALPLPGAEVAAPDGSGPAGIYPAGPLHFLSEKRRGLALDRRAGLACPGAGEVAEGEAMDPAEDNGDRSLPARQVQLPPVQPGRPLMGAIIRGAGMGAATAPFLWGIAALTGLGKASVGAALAALIAGVIAGAAVAAVAWLVRRVR